MQHSINISTSWSLYGNGFRGGGVKARPDWGHALTSSSRIGTLLVKGLLPGIYSSTTSSGNDLNVHWFSFLFYFASLRM